MAVFNQPRLIVNAVKDTEENIGVAKLIFETEVFN